MSAAPSWREMHLAAAAHGSLEWLLTNPMTFGLESASPLQRAICRIADGRPLGALAKDPVVLRSLGGVAVAPVAPRELALLSGIRTGKSLFAGAACVRMSQAVDVSGLGAGETPRISICSFRMDQAQVIYDHIAGRVQASPILSSLLLDKPGASTLYLRHPTGRPIEVSVIAGSRAGTTLVARWSAGCVFDEFPRLVGGTEGVINWDDSRDAVLLRLLPGAQMLHVGSPWRPYGPAYEMVQQHHGHPTPQLVVMRATAPDMNPVFWTPDRVEAAKADPDVYRTDVLAEFATPEEALFSTETVENATRKAPEVLPPEDGCSYTAAIDPATRGNGWTLVVTTRKGTKKIVVLAKEWRGSRTAPLDPSAVLKDIEEILVPYRVRAVHTDQHMGDALAALARRDERDEEGRLRALGLVLLPHTHTSQARTKLWLTIRTRMEIGEIELAPVPQLRADLLHLRKRVSAESIAIDLPLTNDGRHCDYAPALMLALSRYLKDEKQKAPSILGQDPETKRLRKQVNAKFGRKNASW